MKLGLLITLVVCTFAASTSGAYAQSTSVGAKFGVISATVKTTGPGSFDAEAELTAAGGVFVAIEIAPYLRIQPEVLMARRRFSLKDSPAGISVRTSGFEVPVLVQVPLRTTGTVRPLLYAGPQFGRISKVTQTVFDIESDISDRIKNMDVSLTFGGGIEIATGPGAVTIDMRGSIGLNELSEDRAPGVKSRAFSVFAGYRF